MRPRSEEICACSCAISDLRAICELSHKLMCAVTTHLASVSVSLRLAGEYEYAFQCSLSYSVELVPRMLQRYFLLIIRCSTSANAPVNAGPCLRALGVLVGFSNATRCWVLQWRCDCTKFVAGVGGNVYHQLIGSMFCGFFLLLLHIRAFTISLVIICVVVAAASISISFVSFNYTTHALHCGLLISWSCNSKC